MADAAQMFRDGSRLDHGLWLGIELRLRQAIGRDIYATYLRWNDNANEKGLPGMNLESVAAEVTANVMTSLPAEAMATLNRVVSYGETCWAQQVRDLEAQRHDCDLGDEWQALADAVASDHWCSDTSCDIRAAVSVHAVYSAAALLLGATECEAINELCEAHPHVGEKLAKGPYEQSDWDTWAAHHDEHGVECESCGAFTYGDDHWRPDSCGNCLAVLPPHVDPDELELTFTHEDSELSFTWNESLTVNVYADGVEVDVFTFGETPTLSEVRQACADYVGRHLAA